MNERRNGIKMFVTKGREYYRPELVEGLPDQYQTISFLLLTGEQQHA